jgi:Domain of unknown function (DUF1835)
MLAPLHVTNGESAGNTLRQTGLGGGVLVWRDVLHEGPVPDVPRAKLLRVRATFLAECGWGTPEELESSLGQRDARFHEALRRGGQVVLWFEHDLYDQLQLLDALTLARATGVMPELLVGDTFLGPLTADELEALWPSRHAATQETLDHAAAVWDAFRAPDPRELARLAMEERPDLPFVAPALDRLLEELPAPADGLSGTERRALQAIEAGARTPIAAFVAAQKLEDAAFLGDAWFFRILTELGRLIETTDGEALPPPPPLSDGNVFARLPIRLTRDGERVFHGELDRVELLGVDRWLGGTHVTTDDLWRWDRERRELLR